MRNKIEQMLTVIGIFVVFIFSGPLSANQDASKNAFGILGGGALTNLRFSNTGAYDNVYRTRLGFLAGGSLDFPIDKVYSLNLELYYVKKGAKLDYAGTLLGVPIDVKGDVGLGVVESAFLVKARFLEGETHAILILGPSVGYIMSTDVSAASSVGVLSTNDEINKFDIGAVVGAGIEFPLGINTRGSLNLRYGLGLSNISKNANVSVSNKGIYFVFNLEFGPSIDLKEEAFEDL